MVDAQTPSTIDLSKYNHLLVVSISGMITAPIISLGHGPDLYIAKVSDFKRANDTGFIEALTNSFHSFGFQSNHDIALNDPKVLIIPINEGSELAIKNALIFSDIALAIFNKKYWSSKAQFLNWDRKNGVAIGAVRSFNVWKPIQRPTQTPGPAIVRSIAPDFWDYLLSSFLRNKLSNLGEALIKCMQWQRDADFSPHITHRFAFMWVGMESMMPEKEVIQGDFIRRYSLLVGAPRGADSKIIFANAAQKLIFDKNPNKNTKKWVKTIEEMYEYRCAILHEGSNDLVSTFINPKKVDWFYHIAKHLCLKVQSLAINGLIENITTVNDLWDNFAINFLYSNKNRSISNGEFFKDDLIEFDWENRYYPDYF